ncbi:MAG: hypothetical protein AAGJ35_04355 [Myxococcota bacterium]
MLDEQQHAARARQLKKRVATLAFNAAERKETEAVHQAAVDMCKADVKDAKIIRESNAELHALDESFERRKD